MKKDIKPLIDKLNKILESGDFSLNINPVVTEINKNRCLGSSNQCYKLIYEITKFFDVKKVLEIGTHKAASTIVFCQAVKDNYLLPYIYTIDNWSQSELKEEAKNNLEKSGFNDYVWMLQGDSATVVPALLHTYSKMDLVFIEGIIMKQL
jgi:predicted O-methyltransferase YrrM